MRHAYPEVPPRVEHCLAGFGEKFAGLMDGVERLQVELVSFLEDQHQVREK